MNPQSTNNNPYLNFNVPNIGPNTQPQAPAVQSTNETQPQMPVKNLEQPAQDSFKKDAGTEKKPMNPLVKSVLGFGAKVAVAFGVFYGIKKFGPKLVAGGIKKKLSNLVGKDGGKKAAEVATEAGKKAGKKAKEVASTVADSAQEVVQDVANKGPTLAENLKADAKLGAAVFTAAAGANLVEELVSEDKTTLQEAVEKKEDHIKNVESKKVEKNAQEYKSNFEETIKPLVQDNLLPRLDRVKSQIDELYIAAEAHPDGTHTRADGKIKLYDIQTNKDGTRTIDRYNAADEKIASLTLAGDDEVEFVTYDARENSKKNIALKVKFSKVEGEHFMSHFSVHNSKTGDVAATVVLDKNGNPKSFLSRNNDDKASLKKVIHFDTETQELKAVMVSDDRGKKITEKYHYESGEIASVEMAKDKDMPERTYIFDGAHASEMSAKVTNEDESEETFTISLN